MSHLVLGVATALDPPLRFFVGVVLALAAGWLGVLAVLSEPGFPWPGRLVYRSPGIECLFLGFLLAACLGRSGCAPRFRQTPEAAVGFVALGLGGAGLVQGLVPAAGLSRLAALFLFGVFCLRWSRQDRRDEVLRSVAFVAFCLLLLRFVLPRAVVQTVSALPTGGAWVWLASLCFGASGDQVPPPGDEYRVFLVLLCYAGALAARWETAPDDLDAAGPAPLPPADRTLPAAPEEAPRLPPAASETALG